jgi:oxazoline/thiazoline dehydrogenase
MTSTRFPTSSPDVDVRRLRDSHVLRFRRDLRLTADDGVTLTSPWGSSTLTQVTPGLREALAMLSTGGKTGDELAEVVLRRDGHAAVPRFHHWLQRWRHYGWLCHSVLADNEVVATAEPTAVGFTLLDSRTTVRTRCRLSRFALCHVVEDTLAVESPLAPVRVMLPGALGGAILGALARPCTVGSLCECHPAPAGPTVVAIVDLLLATGVAVEVDDHGCAVEDRDPSLAAWEFHDLAFHMRSRRGGHDGPCGATYRLMSVVAPPPVVKAPMSQDVVSLGTPDMEERAQRDPSLTRVLEARHSVREHGNPPITREELGEFLYRTARVRRTFTDRASGADYPVSSRPYPGGGAVYELEVYLAVSACAGLAPGAYHYDPLHHQLERLAAPQGPLSALLREGRSSAAMDATPQILVLLTSRFARLSWKYSGLAYALTLKDVGALVQTMYLVATAMGLATCALGTGNSHLVAQVLGTNLLDEPAVGELVLGSAGDDARHGRR